MRLRLACQRTAIWANNWDSATWIRTGRLTSRQDDPPAEQDPAVLIAQEQIRKDGRLILENVTKAIETWRAKTLKPDEPT